MEYNSNKYIFFCHLPFIAFSWLQSAISLLDATKSCTLHLKVRALIHDCDYLHVAMVHHRLTDIRLFQ